MRFLPEDFNLTSYYSSMGPTLNELAASMANAKLAEWLSTGVKVYEKKCPAMGEPYSTVWTTYENDDGAVYFKSLEHEALLINIKPIERECSHYVGMPTGLSNALKTGKFSCERCGVNLRPKWEVI